MDRVHSMVEKHKRLTSKLRDRQQQQHAQRQQQQQEELDASDELDALYEGRGDGGAGLARSRSVQSANDNRPSTSPNVAMGGLSRQQSLSRLARSQSKREEQTAAEGSRSLKYWLEVKESMKKAKDGKMVQGYHEQKPGMFDFRHLDLKPPPKPKVDQMSVIKNHMARHPSRRYVLTSNQPASGTAGAGGEASGGSGEGAAAAVGGESPATTVLPAVVPSQA